MKAVRSSCEENFSSKQFYHIFKDEVYVALSFDGMYFTETTKYRPYRSYSANKVSYDYFVSAFYNIIGLPIVVFNFSNNYGSYQFLEKFILLCVDNIRFLKFGLQERKLCARLALCS